MKPVYLMLLTYQSLKSAQREMAEISAEAKSASNGDFKIAMRTEQSLALVFTSEVPAENLKSRMKGLAYGEIRYVLLGANQLLDGFLDAHVLEWCLSRLPRADSRK